MPVSSCGRDLCVALTYLGKGALCGLVSQDGDVSFTCYLSTSPAARGWSGLYLCLGRYTPSLVHRKPTSGVGR